MLPSVPVEEPTQPVAEGEGARILHNGIADLRTESGCFETRKSRYGGLDAVSRYLAGYVVVLCELLVVPGHLCIFSFNQDQTWSKIVQSVPVCLLERKLSSI